MIPLSPHLRVRVNSEAARHFLVARHILFPERGQTHNLALVESPATSTGVMLQRYRPAGRATLGRADE